MLAGVERLMHIWLGRVLRQLELPYISRGFV